MTASIITRLSAEDILRIVAEFAHAESRPLDTPPSGTVAVLTAEGELIKDEGYVVKRLIGEVYKPIYTSGPADLEKNVKAREAHRQQVDVARRFRSLLASRRAAGLDAYHLCLYLRVSALEEYEVGLGTWYEAGARRIALKRATTNDPNATTDQLNSSVVLDLAARDWFDPKERPSTTETRAKAAEAERAGAVTIAA